MDNSSRFELLDVILDTLELHFIRVFEISCTRDHISLKVNYDVNNLTDEQAEKVVEQMENVLPIIRYKSQNYDEKVFNMLFTDKG